MPTIMPNLTPPNPSTAAVNPTRSRAAGSAPGAADAPASPFPLELNRARARTAEPERDQPSERAAPSKRSPKADTAKKAKAARKANDDATETETDEAKSVKGKTAKRAEGAEAASENADGDPADVDAAAAKEDAEGATDTVDDDAAASPDASAAAAAVIAGPGAQQTVSAEDEAEPELAGDATADTVAPSGVAGATVESMSTPVPATTTGAPQGDEADSDAFGGAINLEDTAVATVDAPEDAAAEDAPAAADVSPRKSGVRAAKAQDATATNSMATDAGSAAAPGAGISPDMGRPHHPGTAADEMDRMVDALGRQFAAAGEGGAPQPTGATGPTAGLDAPPPLPPEARFAEANHANLVTSMRSQLMPNGGSMRIRLDPPQLGALQVTVHMRDGVMTASFETSSDEATKLLSHSLAQLKGVLESQGVSVEKLHVQQGPREAQSAGRNDNQQQEQPGGQQQREASREEQQEHQRKEMMRRMWRRLSGAADPLDVTG